MAHRIVAYTHAAELLPEALLGLVGALPPGTAVRVFAPLDPGAFRDTLPHTTQRDVGRQVALPDEAVLQAVQYDALSHGYDEPSDALREVVILHLVAAGGRRFFTGKGIESGAFYWHELSENATPVESHRSVTQDEGEERPIKLSLREENNDIT